MSEESIELITTFYVDSDLFGLEVMKVQEVTKHHQLKIVPLAPSFVRGLINLRGQIATALGLRELFKKESVLREEEISVVCKMDGNLVSLIVDSVGDVVQLEKKDFERPPHTIQADVRRFIKGIYKMNGVLLSILDLEELSRELSPSTNGSHQQYKEMR